VEKWFGEIRSQIRSNEDLQKETKHQTKCPRVKTQVTSGKETSSLSGKNETDKGNGRE